MQAFIFTLPIIFIANGFAGTIDKCHYGGITLTVGDIVQPKDQCKLVKCIESCTVSITQCADEYLEPPCNWGDSKYPDAEFPRCCEKEVVCPRGHSRKCRYNNLTLSVDEEAPLAGECAIVRCLEDGSLIKNVCGNYRGIPNECRLGDYLYPDEAFPKCCEKDIICPEGLIVRTVMRKN